MIVAMEFRIRRNLGEFATVIPFSICLLFLPSALSRPPDADRERDLERQRVGWEVERKRGDINTRSKPTDVTGV